MKTHLLFLPLWIVAVSALHAGSSFITLDASLSGSRSEQQSRWESGYGSYDRSTYTGSKVDIVTRNAGRTLCSVHIITTFFARPMYSVSEDRTICGLDDKSVDLDPSRDIKFSVASHEIAVRDQNYAALGQREIAGRRIEGWIVCVLDQGTNATLATKASSSALESLASDRQKLAVMVADYERERGISSAPKPQTGQVVDVYGPVVTVEGGKAPGLLVSARYKEPRSGKEVLGTVFVEHHPDELRCKVGTVINCSGKLWGSFYYYDAAGQKKIVPNYQYVGIH